MRTHVQRMKAEKVKQTLHMADFASMLNLLASGWRCHVPLFTQPLHSSTDNDPGHSPSGLLCAQFSFFFITSSFAFTKCTALTETPQNSPFESCTLNYDPVLNLSVGVRCRSRAGRLPVCCLASGSGVPTPPGRGKHPPARGG